MCSVEVIQTKKTKSLLIRKAIFIGPMQKWLTFQYSFVCIQISLTNLALEFKSQKEHLKKLESDEADRSNFKAENRISKSGQGL